MKLLTTQNAKTVKGEKKGYLTFILYMAPADIAGYNACPKSTSIKCKNGCLYTAGRGAFNNVQTARIKKTVYFFENRESFMADLVSDIKKAIIKAEKQGLIPVFRLNGTSDIAWEKIRIGNNRNIMELFPNIQFYDYTKIPNRNNLPNNYNLTFSHDGFNNIFCDDAFKSGKNISVVFDKLPETYNGIKVIDGDESDLRFLDENGVIVGLKAKGKAKTDYSGFVIRGA
jgi:hypothetical protein